MLVGGVERDRSGDLVFPTRPENPHSTDSDSSVIDWRTLTSVRARNSTAGSDNTASQVRRNGRTSV